MIDFIPQMAPHHDELEQEYILEYLRGGGWLTEFKKTEEFEEAICAFTGAKYCSVVNNGTVSLFIALKALGIGEGDEVIVPGYTMIATPNSVRLAGATPVLADVDISTLCLDLPSIQSVCSDCTKAVMLVTINGRSPHDLSSIQEWCLDNQIHLIEDAAQSLGSLHRGIHLGRYGIIGSFSFSAPKIITTGQGGALITDDEPLYERVEKLKDFGRASGGMDIHEDMGWNFKFTDIQAVIGLAQMKKLQQRVAAKKVTYERYKQNLNDISAFKFIDTDLSEVCPWFNDALVEHRDDLIGFLKEKNVGSRPMYPAVHTQSIYSNVKSPDLKNCEYIGEHGIWLPSSWNLSNSEVDYICECIRGFYNR